MRIYDFEQRSPEWYAIEDIDNIVAIYKIWAGIKTRCYNPQTKDYYRYGGRGILMDVAWKNNKSLFIQWSLENGYKKGLQVDRVDNDKGYEPSNCQWITCKENIRKNSNTKLTMDKAEKIRVEYIQGKVTQKQLADKYGVTREAICAVLLRRNWNQ